MFRAWSRILPRRFSIVTRTIQSRPIMTSTDAILAGKYPAKAHARRVAEYLRQHGGLGEGSDGVIYLEAQKTRLHEDTDTELPFRQRRPFYYLSGCLLPDAALTYHFNADELTLYIPPLDPDAVVWSGLPLSPEEAEKQYDVDRVRFTTDVNAALGELAGKTGDKGVLFAIKEQVSEGISFAPFTNSDIGSTLRAAIEETRVVKDDYEIALIRKANEITNLAHRAVLRAARTASNERELEAAFIGTCIAHGARQMAYHPIVASGTSSATLHYVSNDQPLVDPETQERKLNLLLDAGGEYRAYAADVTRTFPLSGKFTPRSRAIYDLVLQMQLECLDMIKEGVQWEDVHVHAHRVAIRGLLKLGILRSGSEDELLEKRISTAFFPHGLGHYLGLDTHDTGGHANYQDPDPMFRYLRVRGKLPAGSVITVEPGVYFCRFIIEPFLKDPAKAKYIDQSVLDEYWSVGGVRIEDNVVITKDGHENLTTAPKVAEEVQALVGESV